MHSPLGLLSLPEKLTSIADTMLPFSTGFEIECNLNDELLKRIIDGFWKSEITVDQLFRRAVPSLLDVNIDSGEQRFRISNGIQGFISLYQLCEVLKSYSTLNPASGIHYHVDFTKYFGHVNYDFIAENNNWILKELDTWGYSGVYNKRQCSFDKKWLRYHCPNQTLEFRIGEMSFDYEVLVKRIIHANAIVTKLIKKNKLSVKPGYAFGINRTTY